MKDHPPARFGEPLDRPSQRGQAVRVFPLFRSSLLSESALVSSSLEIRAPRPHVQGLAVQLDSLMSWLWSPDQVSAAASTRDLPNGTRQLIVRDGDKLRTQVVHSDEERVVIEAAYIPRAKGVPARKLSYELTLEGGPGTTRATLSLSWLEGAAPVGPAAERRWRRNVDQCLERLASTATGGRGISSET